MAPLRLLQLEPRLGFGPSGLLMVGGNGSASKSDYVRANRDAARRARTGQGNHGTTVPASSPANSVVHSRGHARVTHPFPHPDHVVGRDEDGNWIGFANNDVRPANRKDYTGLPGYKGVCNGGKTKADCDLIEGIILSAIPLERAATVALKGVAWTVDLVRASREVRVAARGVEESVEQAVEVRFRSNTSHIFRKERGHLAEDTPQNRQIIESAIEPSSLHRVDTLPDGAKLETYRRILPDGTQAWRKFETAKSQMEA